MKRKIITLTPEEEKHFQPGCFVMLHHASKHEDAGRIGQITSRNRADMITEFFHDERIGKSEFSLIPLGHWMPVPGFLIEQYEHHARGSGWRLSKRGEELFHKLGWEHTQATLGQDSKTAP